MLHRVVLNNVKEIVDKSVNGSSVQAEIRRTIGRCSWRRRIYRRLTSWSFRTCFVSKVSIPQCLVFITSYNFKVSDRTLIFLAKSLFSASSSSILVLAIIISCFRMDISASLAVSTPLALAFLFLG